MCRHPITLRKGLLHKVLYVTVVALVLVATVTPLVDALVAEGERPLYKDLGVATDASKDDIRRAFRRLTREHHPDTKETFEEKEAAKEVMARVLRAYEVLSDDIKRTDYDQTGFIPGEAIDPKEHSAKDIFDHYHQKMPIFSKTESIESFATVDRIKSFRGNRIHLIQVYDDACSKCRVYSNPWETLSHSGLVTAGIVKMYRIDAKSVDGPQYMKELGISYTGSEPTVVAFIDGERWRLYGIKESLKRQKERMAFEQLLDFVMNFFYEAHLETISLQAPFMDGIVRFLQAPRSAASSRPATTKPPIRVLFPKLNAESVPLALCMRLGDQAVVRSLEREPLLDFVEQHCNMEVNVYDRRGELVPLPEFVVVSTQPLPGGAAAAALAEAEEEEEEAEGATQTEAEGATQTEATGTRAEKCKGIELGASAALSYEKAYQFVQSLLPPPHDGMTATTDEKPLPYLDAMNFAEVCEKNCVMWVRESCAAPTEPLALQELQATTKVLTNDFLSFKTGYLCLDEQPLVAQYVNRILPQGLSTVGHRGPLLLAMMDSDDFTLYSISSLQEMPPLELTTRDLDAVLSHVVDSKNAAKHKQAVPLEAGVRRHDSEEPFTSLLPYTPFPMSTKQRYSLLANTIFSVFSPYITNVAPFFFMWLVHTKVLGRKNSGPDQPAAEAPAAAANAKAPPTARLPKFPTGARKPRRPSPEVPRPKNAVCDFTKADVAAAKDGKGFLLLLLDDRPLNSPALKLPLLMSDARFTVRMLTSNTSQWNEWVRRQVSEAPPAGDGAKVPEEERGLCLVAIRKGRMQSVAKPEGRDMEAFLSDILDGTVSANVPLPEFALATE